MANDAVPKCPRCQSTSVKLVSEKHRFSQQPRSRPITTLSVYGCTCGTGFTHMVRHELAKIPEKAE